MIVLKDCLRDLHRSTSGIDHGSESMSSGFVMRRPDCLRKGHTLNAICPAASLVLPDGLAEQNTHTASIRCLEQMTSDDFNSPPGGTWHGTFAPVGSLFILIGRHPLIPAAHFVSVPLLRGESIVCSVCRR